MIWRRTFAAGVLALATAPIGARAQVSGRTYRIAVWNIARRPDELEENGSPTYRMFFQELRRLGLVEGRNLIVDRYANEGRTEFYEPTVRRILDSRPDVIVPNGTVPARMLARLTTTTPIVVLNLPDPISTGLVQSLARPGGNLTGFAADGGVEIEGLVLQLLKEAVPQAQRLGFLETRLRFVDETVRVLQDAAARLNVELVPQLMDGPFDADGYRDAFAALARQRVAGVYVARAAEHGANSKLIVELAASTKLPAIYGYREFVDEGGLMSYGVNLVDNYRKTAGYVARIINGEKPGDLPVQQPTVFDMVVNMKAARALGLTIPESILIRATEVIE